LRILGIDPGTLRLGYGVIECAGNAAAKVDRVGSHLQYVECGVISAPARHARSVRLAEIGRGLRELMTELRPDAVAMEEAFHGANVQSALALGEARGVAIYVASEHGVTITGYPPATVKLAVVGHGRATKQQIGYLVRALLAMRRTPEPDAADALAIAICHARRAPRRQGGLTGRRA
jgi:crossover junction endodeoxyribonuclease RuvC